MVDSAFRQTLVRSLERWELVLSSQQFALMEGHFAAMVAANRQLNLTRITDPVAAAVKHYADSLAPVVWAPARNISIRTVLDVGTGAGFPAVPLAIARPDWSVTAIDSTGKKTAFLADWVEKSGLANLSVQQVRAEHWHDQPGFSLVIFRATGPVEKCIRQAGHLVARKGCLVCFKTAAMSGSELRDGNQAAKALHWRGGPPFEYDLQLEDEVLRRQLILYARG